MEGGTRAAGDAEWIVPLGSRGVKVLIVGSGAREHALALALARDPEVGQLHAAPGNPGIAELADLHPVDVLDGAAVAALAIELAADLVVIGPEAPLVAGVADAVRAAGVACFGPTREAAALEGSKAFAKEVMAAADVPTARSYLCTTPEESAEALDAFEPPYVVKADGLAAGKGVVVTRDRDAALAHAAACGRVVIEEHLDGPEVSLFGVTDGVTVLPLEPAQDFKRLRDGDEGPNTGGMGAYSPLPWAPPDLIEDVVARVLQPTVDEMRHRGSHFAGLLYAGLALTDHGVRVIEFNARFGDPETQVVLPRLRTPLAGLLMAAATGQLDQHPPLVWDDASAVTVVVASEGYPAAPVTGDAISGADRTGILHAGTTRDAEGVLRSSGGRVLSAVGMGGDLAAARAAAYQLVDGVSLRGSQVRSDIAAEAAEQMAEHEAS